MANAIYPKYKEALLGGSANVDLSGGTVKAALVAATYTYSSSHQFLTDLTGVVGTAGVIGAPKSVTNGVFDGADVTYTAVTGSQVTSIVIYIDTGVAGTSRLVAYIDTGVTNLPVTPNGGNITITWDNGANKIFAL